MASRYQFNQDLQAIQAKINKLKRDVDFLQSKLNIEAIWTDRPSHAPRDIVVSNYVKTYEIYQLLVALRLTIDGQNTW